MSNILEDYSLEFEKDLLIHLLKRREQYLTMHVTMENEELANELGLIAELLLFYEPLDESKFMSSKEGFEDLKQRLIKEGLWKE